MEICEYLKIKRAEIDEPLENYLPKEDVYPPKIHRAMRYSLLNGGKRIWRSDQAPHHLMLLVEQIGFVFAYFV